MFTLFIVTTLLATSVVAKHCQNFTVPVSITARNDIFNVLPFETSLDVTSFVQDLLNIGGNTLGPTGTKTVSGQYNVSVEFCQPDSPKGKDPILQFLVHDIGFDKTYWDSPYANFNYSYVDVAVDQYGFCTIAIDRLGIYPSSIVADGVNTLQLPLEMAAVYEITTMLRAGTLSNVPDTFNTIVHVGHGFGASIIYEMVAQDPTASDGIVLTGFSQADIFFPLALAGLDSQLARLNQPLRFGNESYAAITQALLVVGAANNSLAYINEFHPELDLTLAEVDDALQNLNFLDLVAGFEGPILPTTLNLPNDYLTWADIRAFQFAYFDSGHFDPALLVFLEMTKQPFTPGELLTFCTGTTTAPDFKGPVLVVTGNQDEIYCGGDCQATGAPNVVEKVKTGFPAAKVFEAYIQPNTGHALNFHYDSISVYKVIQNFMVTNGLKPS